MRLIVLGLLLLVSCGEKKAELKQDTSCANCAYPEPPLFHFEQDLEYPDGQALLITDSGVLVMNSAGESSPWETRAGLESAFPASNGLVLKSPRGEVLYLKKSGEAIQAYEYYTGHYAEYLGETSVGTLVFSDGTIVESDGSIGKIGLPSGRPVHKVRLMSGDFLAVETGLDRFQDLVLYQAVTDEEGDIGACNGPRLQSLTASLLLVNDCGQPVVDVSSSSRAALAGVSAFLDSASASDGAVLLLPSGSGLVHVDASLNVSVLFSGVFDMGDGPVRLAMDQNDIVVKESMGLALLDRRVDAKQKILGDLLIDNFFVRDGFVFYIGGNASGAYAGVFEIATSHDARISFSGRAARIVPIP